MQKFYRTELVWVVSALKYAAKEYKEKALCPPGGYHPSFFILRAEQLEDIATRLQLSIDKKDHRIGILF